ncbi:CHAT domain-containing protein [Salsipaludibacter albus]|uniref:CHAT domain-containing protein n=1 Tax=Salsipaludibacter albus TaxID=2849650 RepID=UPI001EE3ACF0|nr:CHAT domain-containing protein [Salsipaludibacter albus]MBY5163485.1 CHAT domain-containing protein [Salsipaludibacter albus]
MGATIAQVAAPRRTVSEVSLELGPLDAGVAPVTVRTPAASVTTTMRWPGNDVLAGWNLLAAGGAPVAEGFTLGTELFETVFADPRALLVYHDAGAGGAFVRLRIRTADAALASLPWELLADPSRGEFLGRSGSIVRWFDPPDAVPVPAGRSLEADGPVRTLVVGVSPPSAPLPDLGVELAAIRRVHDEAVERGVAVAPTVLENATRRDLADAVREATESGRPYDVLHLSCHAGVPEGSDHPALVLAEDGNDDGLVSPDALARLVADVPPRLVVLNACASLDADGLSARVVQPGFARALLERGVPAIVGMQEAVDDAFAAAVGGDLHQALLDGRSVDAAVTDVRRLVEDRAAGSAGHFGIPVVYLAPGQDRLVPPPAPPDVDDGPPPHPVVAWFRAHKWIATLLVVVIPTLLTYITAGDQIREMIVGPPLPVLTGDFNLAVADFGLGRDVDPDLATLDESVARQLTDEVCDDTPAFDRGDFQVDCSGPAGIPPVRGATELDRDTNAADLAGQLNANMLVHGTVTGSGDDVTFRSWLEITDADLGRAPELVGSHELDPIEARILDDFDRRAFRREVEASTRGLAQLVFALGHYSAGEWEQALAVVDDIDPDDFPLDPTVVFLLEGNVHGRLGDFAAARAAYREARERDPDDPNAVLGLAELAFQDAVGGGSCDPGTVDVDGLDEAAGLYEDVAARTDEEDALAATSATFGLARLRTCRSVAELADEFDQARVGFERVVADHENHPESLVDTTAESHSFLALLARSDAVASGDPEDWEVVARHADAALDLRPAGADRESHFLQQRAEAEHELGQDGAACRSLDEARDGATDAQMAAIDRSTEVWGCN